MLDSAELLHPYQVVNSHWDTGGENRENNPNSENFTAQKSIAALPLLTYQAGETVIADGSSAARLFILKQGAVTEFAKVTEPGALFGELSVLLNQPNKLEVRALETSQFQIADAALLLRQNPIAIHVAMALARQLDNANDLQASRTLRSLS